MNIPWEIWVIAAESIVNFLNDCGAAPTVENDSVNGQIRGMADRRISKTEEQE